MHQRQAIIDAIIGVLVNQTDAADRVEIGRQASYQLRELPAIAIYHPEDRVDREFGEQLERRHLVTIAIEVRVDETVGTPALTRLNELCEQIETAMNTAVWFDEQSAGDQWKVAFDGTDLDLGREGTSEKATALLRYEVEYTKSSYVEQPFDDIERTEATYNVGGNQDPADRPVDNFQVEQS